ncbi:GIY-YIG nuclease family protein [Candidatus Bathyarchaeota archaeon]|nr:GIY-YIG nuclease family protein [Candidatus Bathyarchaeota archaeon]
MTFFVYILLCEDGSFYTGYTKNLDNRVKQHMNGKGARYTKSHKPKKIVYVELFETRSGALKRERRIKKNSHNQKQGLITKNNYSPN